MEWLEADWSAGRPTKCCVSVPIVLPLPATPRVCKKLFCRRIRFPEERDGYKDGDSTVHITSCRNIGPNLFPLLLHPTEL